MKSTNQNPQKWPFEAVKVHNFPERTAKMIDSVCVICESKRKFLFVEIKIGFIRKKKGYICLLNTLQYLLSE